MKTYVSLKTLFKEAFLSIFAPHKTFARIPKKPTLNYKKLIATLFLLGFIGQVIQLPAVHGGLFFHPQKWDLFVVTFVPFFSVGSWALGSLFFYYIGKFFGKNISLKRAEIAAFYLWFVWLVMPVVDFLHPLLGIPFILTVTSGVAIHFSWFFGLPVLILETFFLLKNLLGLSGKKILIVAVLAPVIDRLGLDNLPILTGKLLSTHFPSLQTIDYFLLITPVFCVFFFCLWLAHKKKYTKLIAIGQTTLACLLVFTSSILMVSQYLNPLGSSISKFKTVSLPGESHQTHSYTWTSSDVTNATTVTDSPSALSDGQYKWYSDTYSGTGLNFSFTPANQTISDITVKVVVTTHTNGDTGTLAMQGCFFNQQVSPPNTYYCSEWQGVTTNATYNLTISPSAIRTYVAGTTGSTDGTTGLGTDLTATDWTTLVNNMAATGNQMIIHIRTIFHNCGYCASDSISYTPANLIIDYRTTLTHYNWQWYQNTNAYIPTTQLAFMNTQATNVHRNDKVRLRMSLASSVAGDLTAADQPFKLQYAIKIGAFCTSGGTIWNDVGSSSSTTAAWRGSVNAGATNGTTLTGPGQPLLTFSSPITAMNLESYQDNNPSASNPNAITFNTAGEWDWSIQNYLANENTTYCFKMVTNTGVNNTTITSGTFEVKLQTASDIVNLRGLVNLRGKVNLR